MLNFINLLINKIKHLIPIPKMNNLTFKRIKGTKLHRYLIKNDILNLYPSLNKSIKATALFHVYDSPIRIPKSVGGDNGYGGMDLKHTINNDALVSFYNLLYHHDLSFIVHEIINTVIENENPMSTEYIIMFLQAVKYDDYTSINMIISNGFDMNEIGKVRERETRVNIITAAYRISKNRNMIIYLLDNGGNINNKHCYIRKSACSKGDVYFVNYLLDLGTNNDQLLSMFKKAVEKKNFTIADSIINYGLKIEDKYQDILDSIRYYVDLETVEYLINHGLDINKFGPQILWRAARAEKKYRLVDFCLQHNMTVNQETLMIVFRRIDLDMIKIFAKNCIDLSEIKFENTEYNFLIESLKNNGLNMILFTKFLLKLVEIVNSKVHYFDWY